ncbi:GMC family oxidoreductase N-terminal domain-containing protein [Leifsonia sp. NPDC058194]|uniref:GMC family oxidoreductase N-terminal domain-containing protein n=1 Tax=Leifsonia sp. NPDC058194 TaxID=3346374 RepID=UPI0036D8B727
MRADTLRLLVDAVLPVDDHPGGWEGGVAAYLERAWERDLRWAHAPLTRLAERASGAGVRDAGTATAFVSKAMSSGTPPEEMEALLRVCREGYYGGDAEHQPAGWSMLGYSLGGFQDRPTAQVTVDDPLPHYDAIVIGSGPGGSVAARTLARNGARVLIVERGRAHTDRELWGDHLHGKRLSRYDPVLGPGAGNPRTVVEPDGSSWVVDGDGSGDEWGLNALGTGGGTRVWQGMSWRFLPEDFEMARRHGVPPGSSLADWPIGYDELAPYYDRAEWELGVSGALGPLTSRMPGHVGYPMPPLPGGPTRQLLGSAAARAGWASGPIPFAINSVPRNGRPACIECLQCIGHTCPVDAKNGAHNTFLPEALDTGSCDLLTSAQALAIEHRDGRASAVRIRISGPGPARVRVVRCDRVIVAAGAIETPRLVLASALGNAWVGRNLQGHAVSLLVGSGVSGIPTFSGPGHSVATMDFVHGGGAPFGGGVLFDAFSPYPMQYADWMDALGAPRWGASHKAAMRDALGTIVGVMTMGQEVPTSNARITIDPAITDAAGMPSAVIHRAEHPATARVRDYLTGRMREWLASAGCTRIVDVFGAAGGGRRSPATEHSAGTMRMGASAEVSATDPIGRVWGTSNVHVCDGSLHPTNGSVNPTLTLIANAMRVAEGIAAL